MLTGTAIAAGWLADRVLVEPPVRWHPVARFGSLMNLVEQRTYRDDRGAGVVHAGVGIGLAWTAGWALARVIGRRPAIALATAVCVGGRMLDDEVAAVGDALAAGDLTRGRQQVGRLVGRRTDVMDEHDVARAAIESLAENTVDAVVGSLWWAAVAGAPGVLAHRAVNTLDAMVGHRNERYERFGWASARLDDLANYVPARLTAMAVAAVRPDRAGAIRDTVRRDAPAHPSPNGGVIEAAVAAALGRCLGGVNRYGDRIEDRGHLGTGAPPDAADITRTRRLMAAAIGVVVAAITLAR